MRRLMTLRDSCIFLFFLSNQNLVSYLVFVVCRIVCVYTVDKRPSVYSVMRWGALEHTCLPHVIVAWGWLVSWR